MHFKDTFDEFVEQAVQYLKDKLNLSVTTRKFDKTSIVIVRWVSIPEDKHYQIDYCFTEKLWKKQKINDDVQWLQYVEDDLLRMIEKIQDHTNDRSRRQI